VKKAASVDMQRPGDGRSIKTREQYQNTLRGQQGIGNTPGYPVFDVRGYENIQQGVYEHQDEKRGNGLCMTAGFCKQKKIGGAGHAAQIPGKVYLQVVHPGIGEMAHKNSAQGKKYSQVWYDTMV